MQVANSRTSSTTPVVSTPSISTPQSALTPPISDQSSTKPISNSDENATVSAYSLSSIRAKKELIEQQKSNVQLDSKTLPTEVFTETELLEQWYKYADRLNDKGHKIMEALLRINDPKIEGEKIIHTLPNAGSKLDFEKEKPDLLAFLRAKLHNYQITLEIEVNEEVKSKVAFTPQDKFNRMNEINPHLELLKKAFDLDL